MSGIESILDVIKKENKACCEALIDEAKEKSKSILDRTQENVEKLETEFAQELQKTIENMRQKANTVAESEYRRILLKYKTEIIDNLIKLSLNHICDLNEKEYFENIENLIVSNAQKGMGTLRMLERDIKRMPKDFLKRLNNRLSKDKRIEISNQPVFVSGGFVIEYPTSRINCSFESLIEEKSDIIHDSIAKLLFS